MPVGELIKCAYSKCDVEFVKTTHNQKYHSNECCRLATSEKAMAKYYENKARRGGKKRVCRTPGCQTILSRYNPDKYCSECQEREELEQKKKLLELLR